MHYIHVSISESIHYIPYSFAMPCYDILSQTNMNFPTICFIKYKEPLPIYWKSRNTGVVNVNKNPRGYSYLSFFRGDTNANWPRAYSEQKPQGAQRIGARDAIGWKTCSPGHYPHILLFPVTLPPCSGPLLLSVCRAGAGFVPFAPNSQPEL